MAEATQLDAEQEALKTKIDESRDALTQKIEMLEEKVTETVQNATASVAEATATVMETVQNATTSVSDTVDSVTNAFQGTVDTVRQSVEGTVESVKSAFDISRQVSENPWLSFAGAVAVGYAGGLMVQPRAGHAPPRQRYFQPLAHTSQPVAGFVNTPMSDVNKFDGGVDQNSTRPQGRSGFVSQLSDMFGPEISKLQSLAVGVALGSARDMIVEAVPPGMQKQIAEVIDGFTEKLGGQCIHDDSATRPQSH